MSADGGVCRLFYRRAARQGVDTREYLLRLRVGSGALLKHRDVEGTHTSPHLRCPLFCTVCWQAQTRNRQYSPIVGLLDMLQVPPALCLLPGLRPPRRPQDPSARSPSHPLLCFRNTHTHTHTDGALRKCMLAACVSCHMHWNFPRSLERSPAQGQLVNENAHVEAAILKIIGK